MKDKTKKLLIMGSLLVAGIVALYLLLKGKGAASTAAADLSATDSPADTQLPSYPSLGFDLPALQGSGDTSIVYNFGSQEKQQQQSQPCNCDDDCGTGSAYGGVANYSTPTLNNAVQSQYVNLQSLGLSFNPDTYSQPYSTGPAPAFISSFDAAFYLTKI